MKQTIFTVENLFNDHQKQVRFALINLAGNIPLLSKTERQNKPVIDVVNTSLSHIDDIDILIIFRALVENGYLNDNLTAFSKLQSTLKALKYQNLNIEGFALVKDIKSNTGKYDLIILLPDDRDIIFANNVKNIEYILADTNRTDDKIIKMVDFNVFEYNHICLMRYDLQTHTLTLVDTKQPPTTTPEGDTDGDIEICPPPTNPGPGPSDPVIPEGPEVITEGVRPDKTHKLSEDIIKSAIEITKQFNEQSKLSKCTSRYFNCNINTPSVFKGYPGALFRKHIQSKTGGIN